MKHYSIILEALLASCFLFACTQKEEEHKDLTVESVIINQPAAELKVGETLQLRANVSPSNASNVKVSWSSSRQAVATVSDDGLVVAIAEGGTTIYATAGSKRDQCEITVISQGTNTKTVSSVSIDKNEVNLNKASTVTLIATVLYSDGSTSSSASWSSSNSNIASVDVNSGLVTGVNKGDATITAENGGKKATCSVHVIENGGGNVAVTSVSISPTTLSLQPGQSYTLTATVLPDNATNKTVSWSSSNTSIATVSDGVVKAKSVGSATIKAKAENCEATCAVSVSSASVDPNCILKYKTKSGKKLNYVSYSSLGYGPNNPIVGYLGNIGNVKENKYEDGQGVVIFETPITTIPDATFWGMTDLLELEFPNSLKTIKKSGLASLYNLERVMLGNSLEYIGDAAFNGCYALKSLALPESVSSIGKVAFSGCTALVSINIPSKVSVLHEAVFQYCNSLNSCALSNGLKTIEKQALSGCESLSSITIPETVTTIDELAFQDSGLTSIIIPGSAKRIGRGAFKGCENLSTVSLSNGVTCLEDEAFYGCANLKTITIPYSVVSIGQSAFYYCKSLTSVTLPNNLSSLGKQAFYGCELLKTVNIPAGLSVIEEETFRRCDLSSLTIPSNIKTIGERAFCGAGIHTITLESGIREIKASAFESCKFSDLVIPGSVTSIREYAFRNTTLSSVVFSEGLKIIEEGAFACTSLAEVTLPSTLSSIGKEVFGNSNVDKRIKKVTCLATTPPEAVGTSWSLTVPLNYNDAYIYVPGSSVNSYKQANGWGKYSSKIFAISN